MSTEQTDFHKYVCNYFWILFVDIDQQRTWRMWNDLLRSLDNRPLKKRIYVEPRAKLWNEALRLKSALITVTKTYSQTSCSSYVRYTQSSSVRFLRRILAKFRSRVHVLLTYLGHPLFLTGKTSELFCEILILCFWASPNVEFVAISLFINAVIRVEIVQWVPSFFLDFRS